MNEQQWQEICEYADKNVMAFLYNPVQEMLVMPRGRRCVEIKREAFASYVEQWEKSMKAAVPDNPCSWGWIIQNTKGERYRKTFSKFGRFQKNYPKV